jgi:hypothetical protein
MPAGSRSTPAHRVLAAIIATVAMAGCGGTSSRPAGLPTHPPLAAPRATSSTPPAQLTAHQQVHAVVTRYFEVLNQLHVDMNDTALADLFTPECPCQEQVRAIRGAAANGERYLDRIRLEALRINLDGPRTADVVADYQLVRGGLVDAAGRRLTRNPPHRVRWDFQLRRARGRWRIARIDDLS